ncbi:MAG: heterodisulfide reductase-related iron-sulfur binding cluster [Myxococcota bacterium]
MEGPAGPLADLLTGTMDCVHCGLCLPACPTYRETGREGSSPRGRIHLMRAVAEGRLPLGEVLAEEAYLCLGCRACETACPSGVAFGSLLERTRAEVDRAGLRRGLARFLERRALRDLVPHPRRLRLAVDLLAAVQALRVDRLLRALLPERLKERRVLLPPIPGRSQRRPLPALTRARGPRRGRVGFLAGCVMPELFGSVNHATVRVLARNGFDVVVPPAQRCCGALQAHAGDEATARTLARANAAAFDPPDLDAVVTNSAGCGAALREAGARAEEAGPLSQRVRDVCEWLDEAGLVPPSRRLELRVCYDDPCHLVHGQRVMEAPRRVLEAIPGLALALHHDPTSCCGAAGIYNLTHPAMASRVLARKLDSLAAADPDVIATGNPGCLMQLRPGVAARGLRARVAHPVELLDESYS